MNTYAATTFLAEHYHEGWHPWPFFWLIPVLIWATIITVVIVVRRRCRGHRGVWTLRDAFARGEVTEEQYRERLAVLRETR
jgi:putative membrane protein